MLLPSTSPRRPVNWRSLLLGLVGVCAISSLAAYNDFVLANTYLIGNFLPIGLLLFFLTFLLAVNAPLWKWAPQQALSAAELAVAVGMVLVSCSIPASGLMRYLPASLVSIWYHAGEMPDYRRVLLEMNLPEWVFPRFQSENPSDWPNDPVVTYFYLRTPGDGAVPWSAWMQPLFTWGILIAAMVTAIVCLSVIIRRQWVENERLPFPLADVYTSLIESPKSGRALNPLLGSRGFWIAFAAVFVIHGMNALNKYFQKWPPIPINYDLSSIIFAGPPGTYLDWALPKGTLYFSIIGITFFVQSKVAFSVFFFYLLFNLVRLFYGLAGTEFSAGMQNDQTLGSVIPYTIAILWVGRAHWALVVRQMFRPAAPGEPVGRYLPYRWAGWGLLLGLLVMTGWLVVAGASVVGAVVLMAMFMMTVLVITRIVAETGLIFVQVYVPLGRPWVLLGSLPEPLAVRTTLPSYFYSAFFHHCFSHDSRESLSVFATHSLRVADESAYRAESSAPKTLPFAGAMVLALVVAFFVSGYAMLKVEYAHASTIDRAQTAPLNDWATRSGLQYNTLDQIRDYRPPGAGPREGHHRVGYFTSGVAITSFLSIMRLKFINWPLHPVGLLVAYSYPIKMMWFSVFLGWILKLLILRLGGVELMRRARNVFIGFIVGEAGAAAFWLVVSLVLNAMGMEFRAINLLPV